MNKVVQMQQSGRRIHQRFLNSRDGSLLPADGEPSFNVYKSRWIWQKTGRILAKFPESIE